MIRRMLSNARHFIIGLFASNAPAWLIEGAGKLHASLIYMRAVRSIPAYRQKVKEHLGYVPFILSTRNFHKLPIIDKETYLRGNEFERLVSGQISSAYSIQRSSGYSGTPTYWLKTSNEARKSSSSFRLVWDQYLNPGGEKTLVIVGFSLGTWVSGTDVLRLCYDLVISSRRKLTTVSPGEDVEETLEIIRFFGKHFERLVIFGNPIYAKALVDEGADIDWESLNVVFVTGGETTTEAWRHYMAERLGIKTADIPYHIINAYGASDFGATTATETPLAMRIKQLAALDPTLAKAIFGRAGNLPNLFQYHPLVHHFEQHQEGFLVTYWSQIPLIRYNVHDRGRVLYFNEMKKILAEYGYNINRLFGGQEKQPFKLPFIFVDTRSDGTVSIGGANVFPGNIETAIIEHARLRAQVEHFYISVAEDKDLNMRLVIQLMVRDFEQKSPKWLDEFKEIALQAILGTLIRDNQEYRVTWKNNRLVTPVIQLIAPDKDHTEAIKRHYIRDGLDLEEAL